MFVKRVSIVKITMRVNKMGFLFLYNAIHRFFKFAYR